MEGWRLHEQGMSAGGVRSRCAVLGQGWRSGTVLCPDFVGCCCGYTNPAQSRFLDPVKPKGKFSSAFSLSLIQICGVFTSKLLGENPILVCRRGVCSLSLQGVWP